MNDVLIRRKRCRYRDAEETHPDGEYHHKDGSRVYLGQIPVKGCPGLPATTRSQERSIVQTLPQSPAEETNLPNFRFLTS